MLTEEVEGRADALGGIRPRIVMIQPEPRLLTEIGTEGKKNIHVDQNDTKGPDVGRSRPVCRGTVVPTLKAHVWSTSTVHVRTLCFRGRKAKV